MNPRERILASIIGGALGIVLVYHLISYGLVEPLRQMDKQIASLTDEEAELDELIGMSELLTGQWLDFTSRTFSFEPTKASDSFGLQLKELAKRHGFQDAVFSAGSWTKIGAKTGISTVAQRIGVDGRYDNVIRFLRDIYQAPYLCQITKVSLTPLEAKGRGRDLVKLDITVETPVLPELDKKKFRELANAHTLPAEPLPPFRKGLRGDEAYQALAERNIFRPYQPPPTNVVLIENQDWKTVTLRALFYWDNKVSAEEVKTVAGKANLSVQAKGSIVEINGVYADGQTFGPKRFDFAARKDWTYQVPVHHAPPPPEVVDLAVDNQHSDPVFVEVVVAGKDNKQRNEPLMVFEPGRFDVREYREIQSVVVTAKYSSGRQSVPQTFTPTNGKQIYIVPPEPQEITEMPQRPVEDPPADSAYTVTALLTYEGAQEMVATGTSDRRVIRVGEAGAVDGGTLLAVHPLGGVVRMPTGNYYIYPLGRRFVERVKLSAAEDTGLAAAIDAWSRR
jgi:hypothetical protein